MMAQEGKQELLVLQNIKQMTLTAHHRICMTVHMTTHTVEARIQHGQVDFWSKIKLKFNC